MTSFPGYTISLAGRGHGVVGWFAGWPESVPSPVPRSDDPTGPYETEAQAHAEPMPRELSRLHAEDRIRSGDPDRLARNTVLKALLDACEAAGVEVGAFDRRTLAWLADTEGSTAQVVIGLITRAYAAGREARDA